MIFAAWYAIVVGVLIIGQWVFFIAAGQVPELQTEPFRISFHLAAEFTTAALLVASGIALLRKAAGPRTSCLSPSGRSSTPPS